MKTVFIMLFLVLFTFAARAQQCNRDDPLSSNFLEQSEFCDDDFANINLPKFKNFPVKLDQALKPVFPTVIPDSDGDKEWERKWLEAIKQTYKKHGINFAGHYLFVVRGCGTSCSLGMIVDLRNGQVYFPEKIVQIIASVDSLGKRACRKLGNENCDIYTFKKDSSLLMVIGSLGEETDKHGAYYFKWENNKFVTVKKIEKTNN